MTDEQQRTAIAESVGADYGYNLDYLKDLNAMHYVESTLPFSKRRAYKIHLQYAMTPPDILKECALVSPDETCFATARQRAEAYLKTIGKWVNA